MSYSVNLGTWGKIFPVPFDVVDRHLKIANPVHIKILLYLLRHSGEEITKESIAKSCNTSAENVEDAVKYWIDAGIISQNGSELMPAKKDENEVKWQQPVKEASAPVNAAVQKEKKPEKEKKQSAVSLASERPPRPTHDECAAALDKSAELQALIEYSQSKLKKLLSRADIDTLVSLNLWAGMPTDVILLAVSHCAAIGKENMRYIEKVVLGWLDDGIDTVSKADTHLQELADRSKAWNTVLAVIGIDKRKPSQREEDYSKKWVLEWNFDREMIKLAYDICVNSTGKLAFGYMNKVLERWHEQQLTTPEEVRAADAQKSEKTAPKKRKSSYDIDELERRLNSDFENENKQEEE